MYSIVSNVPSEAEVKLTQLLLSKTYNFQQKMRRSLQRMKVMCYNFWEEELLPSRMEKGGQKEALKRRRYLNLGKGNIEVWEEFRRV